MNYNQMYNLFLNGRITQEVWYNFCLNYLLTLPVFVGVVQRLRLT